MLARYWVNTINFMDEQEMQYGSSTVMTLRYEDLITDVHGNVLAIFKFAALPDDGINLSRFSAIINNTNDKYLNSDNQHLLEIIETVTDGIMQRYQYDKLIIK